MRNKLLLAHIKAPDTGQVLFLGCASTELALHLAQQHPQLRLTLTDAYVNVLDAAQQLVASNQLAHVHVLPPPPAADVGANFDLVIIEQPQSRALARRLLCEAQQRLRENGWLYISGPNELGIKSVIADTQALFGSVQLLGYGNHGRAACAQKRAQQRTAVPAWANQPGIATGRWPALPFSLDAPSSTLRSLAGVFSS